MRILIVENHEDTLAFIRRHLSRSGHEVEGVPTMAEATSSLALKPCDVLLSDLSLPDGDGCLLLESLGAARPPLAIVMSGSGSQEDRARCLAGGFQAYLTKPFSPDELDAVLKIDFF